MKKPLALFYQNPAGFTAALILLVFSGIGFGLEWKYAYIFLAAFAVVLVIDIFYSVTFFKATLKYVKQVNKSLSGENTAAVDSFPLPCVMCDMKGRIVWYNSTFADSIVPEKKKLNMTYFLPDFSYSKYAALKSTNAEFAGKKYTAFITKVKSVSQPMLCFYFFDDTYLKETEAEYIESRPFVMLILIDNIEQLSRQLTDSKFALVSSGIESKIEKWLENEKLILKKNSNGSFFVIGEKRNLDNLSLNKFSVLSEVRNYKFNNTPVHATLSIGVGSGVNFAECEIRAKKALEMSLGRGGDQAAIYTDNGYVYYGGMSNRNNDNSRVSPRQTAANLSMLIKKHKRVIIVGHKFSDYDAVGAAMGICFFAEANGVPAFVALDSKTTLSAPLVTLSREYGFDSFVSHEEALEICDGDAALVVVDTHRLFLVDCPELYKQAGARVVIDHHRRSDDFINDSDIFYHRPSASSTCEMVAELIEYSTITDTLPSVISTALLSGIVLDTKDYVLRTSQRTFEAAAFLRECDADTVAVKKLFAVNTDMIALKNDIINDGEIYNGCMIAATDSLNTDIRIITSKAVDEMLSIEGVTASFVIYNISENCVQISARSLGEENVQLIMERLGGGGHSTMAAAQLKDCDTQKAKAMLIKATDEYFLNK